MNICMSYWFLDWEIKDNACFFIKGGKGQIKAHMRPEDDEYHMEQGVQHMTAL